MNDKDRETLNAILRDRAGMDKRMAELADTIIAAQQELGELAKQRMAINDSSLAEKFGVSKTAIYYHLHGRGM